LIDRLIYGRNPHPARSQIRHDVILCQIWYTPSSTSNSVRVHELHTGQTHSNKERRPRRKLIKTHNIKQTQSRRNVHSLEMRIDAPYYVVGVDKHWQ